MSGVDSDWRGRHRPVGRLTRRRSGPDATLPCAVHWRPCGQCGAGSRQVGEGQVVEFNASGSGETLVPAAAEAYCPGRLVSTNGT